MDASAGLCLCSLLPSERLAVPPNTAAAMLPADQLGSVSQRGVSRVNPGRTCIGEGKIKDLVVEDTSRYLTFPLGRPLKSDSC